MARRADDGAVMMFKSPSLVVVIQLSFSLKFTSCTRVLPSECLLACKGRFGVALGAQTGLQFSPLSLSILHGKSAEERVNDDVSVVK